MYEITNLKVFLAIELKSVYIFDTQNKKLSALIKHSLIDKIYLFIPPV